MSLSTSVANQKPIQLFLLSTFLSQKPPISKGIGGFFCQLISVFHITN